MELLCGTERFKKTFEDTIIKDIDLACVRLSQIVGACGEILERCYDNEELRTMKSQHITDLADQYNHTAGVTLKDNECVLVSESRRYFAVLLTNNFHVASYDLIRCPRKKSF